MTKPTADELKNFPIFTGLANDYLQQVQEKSERVEFSSGAMVFKRNAEALYQYYLLQGSIDLINARFDKRTVSSGTNEAEGALNEGPTHKEAAVCQSDVTLLKIEQDFMDLVLAWRDAGDAIIHVGNNATKPKGAKNQQDASANLDEEWDETDWMSCLLQSPLMTKVPPANIQLMFSSFEEMDVQAEETIIHEGESGDYFYVLAHGEADVLIRHGEKKVPLQSGQFFGEEALIADVPRNATIRMRTKGKLMRLDKELFQQLLSEPLINHIAASELETFLATQDCEVIDVRLPPERFLGAVEGSRNIALAILRSRISSLSAEKFYLVTDDGGRRAEIAVHLLSQAGLQAFVVTDSASLHKK